MAQNLDCLAVLKTAQPKLIAYLATFEGNFLWAKHKVSGKTRFRNIVASQPKSCMK